MTSLFGRMLPLFTGARRVEDLFTEAVARLFERRPDICLGWLESLDLISTSENNPQRYVRVSTQKTFVRLDEHETDSRPDLIVEISFASEDDESEPYTEVVMIESKVGSIEGESQLKRYAGHLGKLHSDRKTLIYITRAYDPKDGSEILAGTHGVNFRQLRWHDLYKFLQTTEKDALVEEVMLFMEEQGMSRSHRLSATDLMALSGVPRAFEILDETLGDEVKAELEAFTGNKAGIYQAQQQVRMLGRYILLARLRGFDLFSYAGYVMDAEDGYPAAVVQLEMKPQAAGREVSVAALKKIASGEGWDAYNLDDPAEWAGVSRWMSLADLLSEEDHIAAVKRFFIESIRELWEELTEFKKENPELPWNGDT